MVRAILSSHLLVLVIFAAIASGEEVVLPMTFKTAPEKGERFIGTGTLIRHKSINYIVTSVPVRKTLDAESRCIVYSQSREIANKSVAELVDGSVGWKGGEDGFVSVSKVAKDNYEFTNNLLKDIEPDVDSKEVLKIGASVYAKAFPTIRGIVPVDPIACTVPLTVVSGETYVRRNAVDYHGVLIYPSFPLCAGSCVYSDDLKGKPIGIISNALPHTEQAFSGFAVLVRIENIIPLLLDESVKKE